MDNVLSSTTTFEMDQTQLEQKFNKNEETGAELLGIYHSHPTASAYPNATDIANANYPCLLPKPTRWFVVTGS
jgi:proteasome lid subunit RPN8/RPN11